MSQQSEPVFTFRDLRDFLNSKTDEQLDAQAFVAGEEMSTNIVDAYELEEDYVFIPEGEGIQPISEWDILEWLDPEDAELTKQEAIEKLGGFIIPKGKIYLSEI